MEQIYEKLAQALEQYGYGREELVFGTGNEKSPVMLLGEAPGKDEVAMGRPFVGRAGKNLEEFLAFSGLHREDLFITNVVKFRPYVMSHKGTKKNRPPKWYEIELCGECLKSEIGRVRPKVIVTLGNTALSSLMEKVRIGEVHGRVFDLGRGYDVFPLYHPASIIYNQKLKNLYLEDLKKLRDYLAKKAI